MKGAPHPPWYRQPMVWLVIALPATAVIASLVTLWIAISAAPEIVSRPATDTHATEERALP